MKTKIIPFDLETAKKIQAREIEGKIVTKNGNRVRIICFDAKRVYAERDIIALAEDDNFTEVIGRYRANGELMGRTCEDDDLVIELPEEAPKHEFKPFDKVLLRDTDEDEWVAGFYSHKTHDSYRTCTCYWSQCIPYEGNQELVGTTKMPKDYGSE